MKKLTTTLCLTVTLLFGCTGVCKSANPAKGLVAYSCDDYKGPIPQNADPNNRGPYYFEIDFDQKKVSEKSVLDGYWSHWYQATITNEKIVWSNHHKCKIGFDKENEEIEITFPDEVDQGFWSGCYKVEPRKKSK